MGPCKLHSIPFVIFYFTPIFSSLHENVWPLGTSVFNFHLQALFQKVKREAPFTDGFLVKPNNANHAIFCSRKPISQHMSLRNV
jgi:hypothetical protein